MPLWPRLALYLGAQALLFSAAFALGAAAAERLPGAGMLEAVLAGELAWGLPGLALTLLFWRFLDRRPWPRLGLRLPGARAAAGALLLGLAPLAAVLPVSLAAGHHRIEGLAAASPGAVLYLLGATALLALSIGLAEEVPFRGYLLPNLAERLGAPAAVALTSVLFAAIHTLDPAYRQPLNAAQMVLVGAALAWLRLGSGSLALPVLTHAAYNLGLLLVVGSPDLPGLFRTSTGPPDLWLGGEQAVGILDLVATGLWAAAVWRWAAARAGAKPPAPPEGARS
jgi:uncharacterized protein